MAYHKDLTGSDLHIPKAHIHPISELSDLTVGTATLVNGTVTVNTSKVTASSKIFLSPQDNNAVGVIRVSARIVGVSFTITSSNVLDTGVVGWLIVN